MIDRLTAWNRFFNSGSVYDYLLYCRKNEEREKSRLEVHDRRTDNKRK